MATKLAENDVSSRSNLSSPPHTASLRPGGLADRKLSMASTRRSSNLPGGGGGKAGSVHGGRATEGVKTGASTPQLENSYKLAPDIRFNARRVELLVHQILEARLGTARYNPDSVEALTTELADSIKSQVRAVGFPRHRLVCHVIIGPLTGQAVRVASRCVWDDKQDGFASVSYQNDSMFAVVTVYGVYFE